jgi:hypothetical protein
VSYRRVRGESLILANVSASDTAAIERLLLYIYGETNALRNELKELADELLAEELARLEGTLASIQSESTELLFAMPDPAITH